MDRGRLFLTSFLFCVMPTLSFRRDSTQLGQLIQVNTSGVDNADAIYSQQAAFEQKQSIAEILEELLHLEATADMEDSDKFDIAQVISAESQALKPSFAKVCDTSIIDRIVSELSDADERNNSNKRNGNNAKEFCGKLTEKMRAAESVVGNFPRCAARLDEASARKVSSSVPKVDDCLTTPLSKQGFFESWKVYQKNSAILVMGQGLNPDGSIPATLKRRAELAARIFREEQIPVIVSGGDDRMTGLTEAMPLAETMMSAGVPQEAILYEGQATTTLENFWFGFRQIRRYMHPKDSLKIKLVTSDWHMPRASYFGKVIASYFKNKEKRPHVPDFFNKLDIKIEEVPVKSVCDQAEKQDGSAFIGSNAASWIDKCTGENRALTKHIQGPERRSVGKDTIDSNVWGVELDPLVDELKEHQARIKKMLDETIKKQCTAPPDPQSSESRRHLARTGLFFVLVVSLFSHI